MTRFERTTRIFILILWGLAFVFSLVFAQREDSRLLAGLFGPPDGFAPYRCFLVGPFGFAAAAGALVLCVVLGRKALVQAFQRLSYPQFSILTLGSALLLAYASYAGALCPSRLVDSVGVLPPHKYACLAGLNMMVVFVPSAVAVLAVGWPWRLVPRSGLISATAACIAYVLWNYFYVAALWRPSWGHP